MPLFSKEPQRFLSALPGTEIEFLKFIDTSVSLHLWELYKRNSPFIYLTGTWTVLMDKETGQSLKNLDEIYFTLLPTSSTLKRLVSKIVFDGENMVLTDEALSDKEFISDFYDGEGGKKFPVEFLNISKLIEEGSEYDYYDFIDDLTLYYINNTIPAFDNLQVCNAYISWYNRLVVVRDILNNSENPEELADIDFFRETVEQVRQCIDSWDITKGDVQYNMSYLINKYFKNSPQVKEIYEIFLAELRDRDN